MFRPPVDPAEEFINRRLRHLSEGKAGKLGPTNRKPQGVFFSGSSISLAGGLVLVGIVFLFAFLIFHGP